MLQEKVPLRVIVTKENKEMVEPFMAKDKEIREIYPEDRLDNLSAIFCPTGGTFIFDERRYRL